MNDAEFAAHVRARYPEGLTGVFSLGGTRTTYILSRNRTSPDPGRIDSFQDYAHHLLERYQAVMAHFFELGGQNIIIPPLSIHNFDLRGDEYRERAAESVDLLFGDAFLPFYQRYDADVYFTGVDALLHMKHVPALVQLGERLAAFQRGWHYQQGRRRVVWEIGAVPLFSVLAAHETMGADAYAQMQADLAAVDGMLDIYAVLYTYYARALYGTDIPEPHLYVGSSRNGDFKLRTQMPLALDNGGRMRLFYTPYPNLFLTRQTVRAIIENLWADSVLRAAGEEYDYSGMLTPELVEAEYQRVMALSADPSTTLGLRRQVRP